MRALRSFASLGLALFAAAAARAATPRLLDELASRLERIFALKEYETRTFGPARWLDGGRAYTTVEDSPAVPGGKDIVRYETATGARRILVSAASLRASADAKPTTIDDYSWSADGRRLLLFTNTRKVWRRNTRGDYWVLDTKSGKLHKVGGSAPESSLMFAKFSPDGERVAYVHQNNIYVQSLRDWLISRLTADGSSTIINGTSDWVSEEELDLRDAYRWSPDGRAIAFWRFDTAGVGIFSLVNDTDTLYPVVTTFAYPKAGSPNSAIRIGVVDAAGGTVRFLALPGDPRNTYVPRMEWVDATGEIVLQQLNRLQNTNDVWIGDAKTGMVKKLLHDEDAAWLDVVDSWRWLPAGRELLWVSERDGWRHAWAAPREGGAMRIVTSGDFDLESVGGVDAKLGALYFIASPGDATRRYLYRAPLDGGSAPQRVTPANHPGTHSYDISPDGKFAFHTESAMDRPPVTDLVELPAHRRVRVLEDNRALAAAVAPLETPATEFFSLDIGGGVVLDGWMLRPRSFDPARKYPLLMFVYGEPAGVEVTDAWQKGNRPLFHRALADAGYVVACVDNRGTPAPKGRAWRKIIYGKVGVLASEEQAAAVRKLLSQRPYLDPERVASWGWSGGASMTLNLLFRSPELYRVGMAVAPVPDQTLYDTIYQERYMGLPQDNPAGYAAGSPIRFAENLAGNLLLVHGSGDDNVHFQGSERLINRLVALGKPFDFMEYPNRTHAISEGEGTSLHLHALLALYLLDHLPAGPSQRESFRSP